MACKYWYDGKWRSEKEFKQILENGLAERLLKDKSINIPELELSSTTPGATKAPVTVRIRHKIQRNINNERQPNSGDFAFYANNNPLDVIQKSIDQGGKSFPFKIVIKVKGELRTGKGKANEELAAELNASPVNIKGNLKEGVPYMLVPSSYGMYPIQLMSHKIGDTKFTATLRTQLQNLQKATTTNEINDARKIIEKALYRTTVEFKNGEFVIKRYNPNTKGIDPIAAPDVASAMNYLEKLLFRIDYTEINSGMYNQTVANLGAVTTDLFSEKGNFFNSSSFVLEPYIMSTNDQEVLDKIFEIKPVESTASTNTAVTSNQGFTPVGSTTQDKKDESKLFNTSLEEINKTVENTFVRRYSVPNTNQQVEVVAGVVNGKLTVLSVTPFTKQVRKNANDVLVYGEPTKSGEVFNQGVSLFFADKNLPKATTTPISDVEADIEKELFSETDSKGRTLTVFSNTKEKDGLIKTTFTFNRSDKDPSQRNNMITGIPVEKALGDKYTIDEEYIPEGGKVVGVSEIRISKTGAAATVTFEVDGETFQGEVKLNSNTTYNAELAALKQPVSDIDADIEIRKKIGYSISEPGGQASFEDNEFTFTYVKPFNQKELNKVTASNQNNYVLDNYGEQRTFNNYDEGKAWLDSKYNAELDALEAPVDKRAEIEDKYNKIIEEEGLNILAPITVDERGLSSQEIQEARKKQAEQLERDKRLAELNKQKQKDLAALEGQPTQAAPKSIIQQAAQSFTSSLKSLASEQQELSEDQDLADLINQATTTVPEDITETSDDVALPDSLFGDIDFDGDFDREEPNTKLRSTKVTDATRWSKEEELAWLESKLGNAVLNHKNSNLKGKVRVFKNVESLKNYLPKATYEMLLESRKQGKELHGVFTKAALYISQNAAAGTTFHEAFHIVFNLALPLKARIKILNEAYTKFKDELPLVEYTKPDGTKAFRMPSYLEVEELLADKFMEYVQSKERTKFNDPNFEATETAKTFRGLYRMLRVFFNPGNVVNIDTLFRDINFGVYKFSTQFGNTRLPEHTRLRETTAPQKRYDNPVEEAQAFTYLETLMDEVVEMYKNSKNLTELSDKEAIQNIGVHRLYSLMLSRLNAEYISNKKRDKIDMAKRLYKLFDILTDGVKAVEKTEVNGKTILQFTSSTGLLEKFTRNLQKRGLYINYRATTDSKQTAKNTEDEGTQTFEAYNNEEDTYEESWMKGFIEINPMESVSQRLRSFFATIPKYKSNRKNSAKVINAFGVVEKENAGVIFKKVIAEISNSYTMDDMMAKLDSMNNRYPFVKHILEKIEKDPILKTELWVTVASKNYATFAAVYENNGSYSVFNSNRKTLDNIIKEELIAEFLSASNPLFNTEEKVVNYNSINQQEAARLKSGISTVLNLARTQAANLSAAQIQQLFLDISKELSRFKLNVSQEDFNSIWNPESGVPRWENIINFLNTIDKVADEFVKGSNPFTTLMPSDVETREDRKQGRSLIEQLARQLLPAMDKEVISSFRNIDGKTVYNLVLSGFLNKQIEKLADPVKFAEYIQEIKDDPLMGNLPFIKDLGIEDDTLQENLKVVLLDGLTRKGKDRAVSYADMSDIEQEATSINLFYNSGASLGESKRAYFKLPIPSDSPTISYIQGKALTNEQVIDKLVDLAAAEYARIQKVKNLDNSSRLKRVVNYESKGTKFQILDFLNGKVSTTTRFNADAARAAIREYFNPDINEGEFFSKEIEYFKKKGIIVAVNNQTGELAFADKLLDKNIKREDRTEFFKNYLLNSFYMNTQLTTLFGGDVSFYKNTVDYQKRYKQVISPGLFTDTSQQPEYYKGIILKDSIMPTDATFGKYALDLIKKSNIPESEKKKLTVLWTAKFDTKDDNYEGNNETDGATWISPQRRKQQLESLGRWTPQHEASMKRIIEGKETIEDLMLINPPFKPEKPFVFTHRVEEGTVIPTQVKNAETVLTKSYAAKSPVLLALYNDMMDGKFDVAMYESAVKEGGIKNQSGEFSEYSKQADGSFKLSEDAEVLDFKTEDWRLQQETPPHYIDDRGNFGTQLRNLVIGDINLKGDYTIGNKKLKGSEVAKLYQELVVEDLRSSFEDVREMFENPDGSINYERLSAELRKEVLDRELGEDYLDALAIVPDALGNFTTALPLYHPLITYKMESVMNSFFKNRVTKQKIAGGALINTTSFGVSESLKMKKDPKTGGIVYEAMLPAWSKQFFPKNKDGEVDIEALKSNPQSAEILRIIGYRIPTEHKYSMFNIEVVGFTPPAMGATVILPVEVTSIAGLDFDIDKLFFMSRAFKKNARGNFEVIKYYDEAKTPEQAKEVATNIFGSFREFKRFVKNNVSGIADQERMIAIRRELLEKQVENTKEEKKEIYAQIQELKDQRSFAQASGNFKNTSFLNFIQDSIDELYIDLQEELLPFDEGTIESKQSQDAIEFIQNRISKEFNPVIANSKQARDNKKLDIIQGILGSTEAAIDILNPGNFDSLKESAARIRLLQAGKSKEANSLSGKGLIKAAEDLDNTGFNINLPSTQLELFRRNMTGKQLIGIFANHNTHHAKGQFTTLRLKNPLKFNGQEYVLLNQIKNSQGISISRQLAADLAAVVDNAKDPLASFLNLNTFTANTVALMQRAGLDERTIWAFVNQPVIVELTQKYFNDRGSLSEDKHFATIINKWRALLKEKLKEADQTLDSVKDLELTTENLEKNLVASKTTEYYAQQFAVLQAFQDYYKAAGELAMGIQAAKVDTVGVGPTSATNYILLQKQTRILDKIARGTNLIEGSEEIFLGGSAQQMIPGFTKYGLYNPINILNKIFPSIGKVSNNGDVTYSALGGLKEEIADEKLSRTLTEKEAHMVDVHFMNFIASGFPFFNYSQSKDIISTMPNKLREFKKSMPEEAPYKAFLDQLYVVEANSYNNFRRIEYYNTGKTPIETQQIKTAWQRMLEDANPEVKQMGLDLIKYTFFSNGYGFGPYSFANLVPVKFWTNEYQLQNNIVDKYNRPFNDFLKSALDSDKLAQQENAWKNRFIDQFIRNNANKEGFVKSIKIDRDLAKKDEGTNEAELNNVATLAAREAKGGVIRTSGNTLIINRSKNAQIFPDGSAKPVKYLKVFLKNDKVQLYQHIETEYDIKDPAKFQNKAGIDTATYKPVSNLGVSNFLLEYDFNNTIENSNISSLVDTPNPKNKQFGILQEIEADIMAQFSEEAMLADLMKTEGVGMPLPSVTPATETPTEIKPNSGNTISGGLRSLVNPDEVNRNNDFFDNLDLQDFEEYKAAGGKLSEQEFLSLTTQERLTAIWQAKNCK